MATTPPTSTAPSTRPSTARSWPPWALPRRSSRVASRSPLLRGVPAHRGHGFARRDDARLRPDEARRPGRPAHRRSDPSPWFSSARKTGRHRVQPGRLPDPDDVARAGARLSDDRRARAGRVLPVSAACTGTRSSTRPRVLDGACSSRPRPAVYLAGQITGVEGYVESCAAGFVCAVMLAQSLRGHPVTPPPPATALGGVLTHLPRPPGATATSRRT